MTFEKANFLYRVDSKTSFEKPKAINNAGEKLAAGRSKWC
jgi:hypothetical protein